MSAENGGHACRCKSGPTSSVWNGTVRVVYNEQVAQDTFRLRFSCEEIAKRFLPGQFLMLRSPGQNDPLLGRPLAIYDAAPCADCGIPWVDVVYIAVGRGTRRLASVRKSDELEVWGPLGHAFPNLSCDHLVMVAGGIGQTPFLSLAKQYAQQVPYGDPAMEVEKPKRVSLCYGAKSETWLAGVRDFQSTGIDVHVSTDDGSTGHHGRVTDLIEPLVRKGERTHVVCCGPDPMLRATAAMAERLGLPCHVSLETPMACGLGICFSCVTRVVKPDGTFDYRRVCVDGPIFDAKELDLGKSDERFPPAIDDVRPTDGPQS